MIVFKKGKNNCPQVFLGECKHIFKKENINKYISNDLESSFDGSNEENSNKEFLMKRIIQSNWHKLNWSKSWILLKKKLKIAGWKAFSSKMIKHWE